MPNVRLLHKLSPNWPRAGNSSGSISDQVLLAAWIYSLFGKVKVIYKHYQKPFPMQPWLRVLPERSKIHCGEKSQQKCHFLNLHNFEMSVEACIRQRSSSILIHNILLEFRWDFFVWFLNSVETLRNKPLEHLPKRNFATVFLTPFGWWCTVKKKVMFMVRIWHLERF